MTIKNAAIEKLKTQVNEWNTQIKLIEAKIENAGSDIKLEYADDLNELRAKHQAAKEKIESMKESSNDAWWQVKETSNKLWGDLKTGIAKARSNNK